MSIARHIETDSLSNQNISSALAVGSYTADADRMVIVQVLADQVAGNGDYEFYLTLQVGGSGSHYRLIPITSAEAASGVTAVGAQSGMVAVRSGDVLTVYLKGLAGDNATPDTIVRWFELDALQPATAGRTLAVDAAGGVALAASQGAVSYPITVNNESSNPIDGVEVWVSTDSAGTNVVAGTLSTDASGIVTFMLDAGSYYVWRQKSGYNFANPVAITVT